MSGSESRPLDRHYQALTTGRAVVELRDWSSISVVGTDRQSFLHNFCTNDVKRLTPGTGCEAFFTNVKGKIVGHGLIRCFDEEMLFVGAPGQAGQLVEHLDRYVIREDVTLRDTSNEHRYLLVVGAESLMPSKESMGPSMVGRPDSDLVQVEADDMSRFFDDAFAEGFVRVGRAAFEMARIEAGMPLYGLDFGDENLPQEIGRDRQAISFTKGCYLGQETVARIDALGHVNQKLVGLRFFGTDVPERGTELMLSSKNVGAVTSAAMSPKVGSPLALAMIRREANSVGTRLGSAAGECEVVALPIA
jgi:folate-binding protein YgfZ